ncbi:MAG: hypothetical protein K2G70_03110 [Turicibacter sp.]|nr:hypothetical protein [Turicibacter sp.]
MSNVRPVCIYPQYFCCPSHKDCRLYHLCSQLPKKPFVPDSRVYRVIRPVPLNRAEVRYHQEQYRYYNYLWGELKRKRSDYCKRNHEYKMEYQRQYRQKTKPKTEFDSILFEGLCDKNCAECKYDDCILPTWNNKKEYDALYYKKNSAIRKKRSKVYYENNKQKCSDYAKKYRQEHREEILNKRREYWHKNKDELNARRRAKRKI